MIKISSIFLILFFLCATSLKAQLKEFEISEIPRPDVSTVQANTAFTEDALIFVYSSFDNLSFRSSVGAVDKQYYNARANRYEILVKPLKQMIFISATEFMEQKLATINPNPKEDYYFKVEEKKTLVFNKTAPGTLKINSNPTGANISLNGIPISIKTPFTGELNPGRTRIQVSKSKYQTLDTIMNVQSSINEVLTVNLKPSTLWLNIKSNPVSAKVELDGKIIGETPLSKELDLSEKSKQGERLLKLTLSDYAAVNQTIQLYPSIDPLAINVDMKKLEGAYKIESTPDGAEVFMNGEYKGHTPLQGTIPIGTYNVELKMEDYSPSSKKQIIVNAQSTANLKENLILKKQTIENLGGEFEEGELVKDASGNSYKTMKIGNQVWMAENLKTERYSNGKLIPNVTSNAEWYILKTGAWCNYTNLPQNDDIYGKLYNWFAVSDKRKICPIGWHVPSDAEWKILTDYWGIELVEGGKLKELGSNYWKSPIINSANEDFFSRYPAGGRDGIGLFSGIGDYSNWWSSSDSGTNIAWYRYPKIDDSDANRYYDFEHGGFSIRCLKD